jgi:hypothetical protein
MYTKIILARFWSRVNKNGPIHPIYGQCWTWTGLLSDKGYGRLGGFGNTHRISWRIHYGEIPNGLHVCHKCDIPNCVNPDHLFIGTNADNVKDKVSKNRQSKGEDHNSKLTEHEVLEIRRRCKPRDPINGLHALAREFGVAEPVIWNIVHGNRWKHLLENRELSNAG